MQQVLRYCITLGMHRLQPSRLMCETYSVLVHLQRTVVLDAYVSVPVTEELLRQEADGSHRLNTDKLFAAARELGNDRRVDWQVESSDTQVHGIQKPLPEDRVTFNPFLADGEADESPDQKQNPDQS